MNLSICFMLRVENENIQYLLTRAGGGGGIWVFLGHSRILIN